MARKRRSSNVLETARQRLAGLKSVTPPPSLGADLGLDNYEQDMLNFSANLDKYNELIAALDAVQFNLEAEEARLRTKNKRVLAAVAGRYGTDSNEYEAAGGTRDSDRAPRTTKPTNNS